MRKILDSIRILIRKCEKGAISLSSSLQRFDFSNTVSVMESCYSIESRKVCPLHCCYSSRRHFTVSSDLCRYGGGTSKVIVYG